MNKPTNILKYTFYCCLLISFQSCYIDLDDDGSGCESGRGRTVTESRFLPDYFSITNTISANVVIRQDLNTEFRITAPENLVDDIITRVIDGELIIDFRGCYRNAQIDIFISNPIIEGVYNLGSGNIFGDNIWQSNHLQLSISGSGSLDAEFVTDRLDSEITGSGRMDLFGSANRSEMRISGSGNINAFDLDCNDHEITITGSGNCQVYARDFLDVRISGSGNVIYQGQPQINTSITGSGGVINAN